MWRTLQEQACFWYVWPNGHLTFQCNRRELWEPVPLWHASWHSIGGNAITPIQRMIIKENDKGNGCVVETDREKQKQLVTMPARFMETMLGLVTRRESTGLPIISIDQFSNSINNFWFLSQLVCYVYQCILFRLSFFYYSVYYRYRIGGKKLDIVRFLLLYITSWLNLMIKLMKLYSFNR